MLNSRWKNMKVNILIMLFFGIFSFLLTVVFIKLGTIVLSGDGSFHFSRVEELYNNF